MEKGMREAVMAGSRVTARSVAMEGTVSQQGRVHESWAYRGHIMARLCRASFSQHVCSGSYYFDMIRH
jgi:hypothetical protein